VSPFFLAGCFVVPCSATFADVLFLCSSHGSFGFYHKNKVVLKYFELSVMTHETRKSAKDLDALIKVRVGYERDEKYDSDDEPFREMPEPAEPKKRRKKDE